jgi:head-tail adaptor
VSVGPKTVLTLSRATATADSRGGETFTWSDVKALSGVLSILSDRERMMYGKKAEGAEYKFHLDYQFATTIDTADRFVSGSRIFDIVGRENPMNQNRFMILFLTENVNG